MASTSIVSALAIAILGFILLRKGRNQRVRNHPTARWLMNAGLILLGLQIAIYLLFAFGEMASGDLSGAGHFLPVVTNILLALLAWRRPVEGGVAQVLLGIASGVFVRNIPGVLIAGVPMVISGILFLLAGRVAQGEKTAREQQGS